jgi:hypothetical protein
VASGQAAGPSSWLSGPQFAQPGISRVPHGGRVINVGSAGTTKHSLITTGWARAGAPGSVSASSPRSARARRRRAADPAGPTLLAWEHKGIADIVAHLGKVDPAPPGDWPGNRFDLVWVFTANGSGWRFQQVPQLLLAGDSPDPV